MTLTCLTADCRLPRTTGRHCEWHGDPRAELPERNDDCLSSPEVTAATGVSFPETARILGGRDHTTIINSVRRVTDAIEAGGLDRYDFQHRIDRIWRAVTAADRGAS